MRRVLTVFAAVVLFALIATDVYLRLFPQKPVASRRWAPSPEPPAPTATSTIMPAGSTPTSQAVAATTAETAAPTRAAVVAKAKAVLPPPKDMPPKRKPAPPPAARTPVAVPPKSVGPPASANPVRRRSFVVGPTAIEGRSGPLPSVPAGFDPGGVEAKPAPKIAARIELDVEPKAPRTGDPYTVKVFLRNEGKKTIHIREVRVGSSRNGLRSESAVTPRQKDVAAAQVALVAEVASTWKDDVQEWGMDVVVRAAHGEVYRSSVVWR